MDGRGKEEERKVRGGKGKKRIKSRKEHTLVGAIPPLWSSPRQVRWHIGMGENQRGGRSWAAGGLIIYLDLGTPLPVRQ